MFRRKKKSENPSNLSRSAQLAKSLHREAVEELRSNLLEGEELVLVIHGLWDQAMIVTTHNRVLVFKKGLMGGVSFGRRLASWDFKGIHGVQMEMGPAAGFLALQTTNASTTNLSYWGKGASNPAEIANAIPLNKDFEQQARVGVAKLRAMLHEYNRLALPPTARQASPKHVVGTPVHRFCFACGAELRPGSVFCSSCGQKLV